MSRPRPLTPYFAQRLRKTMLCVAGFAVVASGVTTQWLISARVRKDLRERAELCAAALVPGRSGDLTDSVAHLRSQYDGLVAVATLSHTGRIDRVYPDTPAHRSVAESSLDGDGAPAVLSRPENGEPFRVVGVTASLNGVSSPIARQVLILFHDEQDLHQWAGALGLFALLVGMMTLGGANAMTHWFDRRVSGPLHGIARSVERARMEPERTTAIDSGQWRETARIGGLFEDLMLEVAKGEAQILQIARETQNRLQDREAGFDRQLRRAKDHATLDPLTGLRNRSFYDKHLEMLFKQHSTDGQDFSVVMMDVDNFKQYNDTKGHQAGDSLLEFLGSLLRGSIRPEDYAIRYGGDEFVLIFPETTLDQAEAIAERMVKLFAQYVAPMGRRNQISISAGVASLRCGNPETGFDLVANADAAMYAAKRKGKGTVLAHRPHSKNSPHRTGVEKREDPPSRAHGSPTQSVT